MASALPPFDVDRARTETPGCADVLHFNHAGASLMPAAVVERVIGHLRREAQLGGYEAAAEVLDEREAVYVSAAELLGCRADEIALTDSATRAFDTALWSVPINAGDRVLISAVAYGSNALALLELRHRTGCDVVVLPSAPDGSVDLGACEAELRRGAALVALTHVPTNGGLVNPAAEVGALCRAHGVPYLLDACQSVGQLVVDVDAIGCDLLAATSRKYLRGPRGQGLLYVRRSRLDTLRPPMPDIGSAEWTGPETWAWRDGARRFECWEHSVAGRLGLGVALTTALSWGLPAIQARVVALGAALRSRLAGVPGVVVRDLGTHQCGIVTFTVNDRPAAQIQAQLRAQRIHVSVSHPASTLLDMQARGLPPLVRASVHYTNTLDELDQLCLALR